MGAMKDFDRRIRQGGDDAIAAVEEYVAEQERLVAQVESMLQRACDRHWKEWIPVEERLPDFDEDAEETNVLGYYPFAGMISLVWYTGHHWEDGDGSGMRVKSPTHWMPLPGPPEVK